MLPIGTDPRGERIQTANDWLVRTMRLHHKVVEKRMDGLGVHHSQHRMLMRLSHMGRMSCQKDVAEALGVSPACVARTLKPLSAAGLIGKAEGADGRCREISLLPAGQRLVDESIKTFERINDEMFEGFTDDEIVGLTRMLNRLYENLSHMENA